MITPAQIETVSRETKLAKLGRCTKSTSELTSLTEVHLGYREIRCIRTFVWIALIIEEII